MLTLFCQYFLRFWWWFLSKKPLQRPGNALFLPKCMDLLLFHPIHYVPLCTATFFGK